MESLHTSVNVTELNTAFAQQTLDPIRQHQRENRFVIEKQYINEYSRLKIAMDNQVNFVIHAAALKHVSLSEYNPFETIKTNIIGSQNLIKCCLELKIPNVIALSTDKASSPINLYGASKLAADKLFVAANAYAKKNHSYHMEDSGFKWKNFLNILKKSNLNFDKIKSITEIGCGGGQILQEAKKSSLSVLFIAPYWSAFRFTSVPVCDVCVYRHVLPFTDVKWKEGTTSQT